jgi:hypothetical protein
MVLVMAVQQRGPRISCNEIDLDAAEARHIDSVFHKARRFLVADLGDLEGVLMRVYRMVVSALVREGKTITFADLGREQLA